MIKITMNLKVRPETKSEFLETVQGLIEPTRVEDGCLACELSQDTGNPQRILLAQRWSNEAAWRRYRLTSRFRALLESLELLAEPPVLEKSLIAKHVRSSDAEAFFAAQNDDWRLES